jgi:probable phosphoglycerate mutase
MTTIYLIRHAEAEGDLYRIAQGHTDGKATKRGWEQIQALSKRFEAIPVDAVYSSDLYRTCATASAIYVPKGILLHTDAALREANLGVWEGVPWGEISRRDGEQLVRFSMQPHLWRVQGGETVAEVQDRLHRAVCWIGKKHDGDVVSIVSRGFAIRMLLGNLQGYPLERLGESPQEDNTDVSLLELDGDELRVVYRSDNSHLFSPAGDGPKMARERAGALEDGMYYETPVLPRDQEVLRNMSANAYREAGEAWPGEEEMGTNAARRQTTLFGFNGAAEPSVGRERMDRDPLCESRREKTGAWRSADRTGSSGCGGTGLRKASDPAACRSSGICAVP